MKKFLSFVLVLILTTLSLSTDTFTVSASTAENTYAVGDIVEFGSYKQSAIKDDNNETIGFNVEPIKWRILKIEDGKALLVSDEIIDVKQYNSTSATVDGYYGNNYAHSDIREWLINDFYNTAFSSAEKNSIVATTLDNSACATSVNASGSYTKYSSESTTDKVFLLSKDEANAYASKYLGATATDYAYANGYKLYSGAGSTLGARWLLRTAGNNTFQIYYVHVRWGEYMTYFNWNDDSIRVLMGVRPAIYLDLDNYQEDIKREDGFNFYLNHPSNYINVNSTVDIHIGYYLNNVLDTSVDDYIYTISNSNVIGVTDNGWSAKYGQKLKLTAKQEGSSTITVTNPNTSESSSLEIYVTGNESGWNFYNIPKMSIEAGKTTNFYNYSGMVVDEFAYTEHKNSLGATDYYNVTMTVYNSINLYGVVTSHYADGSVYGYRILDKMDSHDTSFVNSLKSLYYSSGDLYYLIKNNKYYSGKSISTENKVTIDVPVGGYISISNNVAVSDMANLVNFSYLLFDAISVVKDSADWVDSGAKIDKAIKDTVVSNLITGILANKAIKDEVLSCLKSSVAKEFKGLNLNYDNLIDAFVSVSDKLIKNVGFNIIEELESEICSAMGIASIGRTLLVDLLNYGAASQNYTTYKTDSLVNESLTEEQLSWGTIETPALNTVLSKEYAVIDNPSVIWKGAGLNLQDSVNMRFKIETDDIEDISVKVTADTGLQWIVYSDAFETTEGGYYVFFDGLNVGQMREAVYLTVYDNNEIVSNTIRYSVESYAFSKQDSSDESLSVLLLAMMKYGNSAYAYAN